MFVLLACTDRVLAVLQVQILSEQGIKEVTLLGQNVNSYADTSALMEMLTTPKPDTTADPFAVYAQVSSAKLCQLILLVHVTCHASDMSCKSVSSVATGMCLCWYHAIQLKLSAGHASPQHSVCTNFVPKLLHRFAHQGAGLRCVVTDGCLLHCG